MKTKIKIQHLILAGLLGTTIASQAAVMILPSSDGQVRDNIVVGGAGGSDGIGDTANAGGALAGYQNNANGNIQPLWAFSLATVPGGFIDAQISIAIAGFPGATAFNLDLHAVRIGSEAFVASDYEDSDSLILEDFWTPADGVGARTADITSYLQGSSWSSSDFLIVGLKTDPLTVTGTAIKWVSFNSAQLAVVPEPSSTALLGLGGLALALRRRRS